MPLSAPERAWFAACLAGGTIVYAAALQGLDWTHGGFLLALGFGLAAFLSSFHRVRLDADGYEYTLDDVPLYALLFLQGAAATVVVMATASFAYEVVRALRTRTRAPELLLAFTRPFLMALWCAAAGSGYEALNGGEPLLGSPRNLAAIVLTAIFLSAFAMGTTTLALLMRRREPLSRTREVLRRNYGHTWLHVLMLAPLGALLALFVQQEPEAAVLLIVPLVMMHRAFETQLKLLREAEATVKAMATYLDERDHYTQGHSERVAGYARCVARRMGLHREDVDRVHRAGLVHDIGKIDVPDAILRKPGKLTEDEREVMRTHVVRATELGKRLVALRQDVPLEVAAYHHERWDGLNSMFGMQGEAIPLESRILAVADAWDAMTSDRPYRKGISHEEALQRILDGRGTQLDPRAVDAFLAALESGEIASVTREWAERERSRPEAAPDSRPEAADPDGA